MNCIKCGRETPGEQLFCDSCIEGMADYPVDPNTPVQLPRRRTPAAMRKPPRRRIPSPEEQIHKLSRRVQILAALLVVFGVLCAVLTAMCFHLYHASRLPLGQNYTAITSTVPAAPAAPSGAGQ